MNLTEEQQRIVAHQGGHAKVSAVAGSGKTTTMVARVRHLLIQGVAPQQMLVLMFNRSARESFAATIAPRPERAAELLLHLIDILVLVDNDVVHMVAHPVRQLFAGAHGHDRLMDEIGIEADVGGLALRFKDGEGLDEIGEPFIQAQGGKELRRRHGV